MDPPIDDTIRVPPLRDTQALLARARHEWGGRSDLWVFGYASLLWRPEFEFSEHQAAHVHGWHRALRMASRVNRGTPERPGLVFALLPGGSCQGAVYRIPRERVPDELERLWRREMPTGVYDPRWLGCRITLTLFTGCGDCDRTVFHVGPQSGWKMAKTRTDRSQAPRGRASDLNGQP